MRNCCGGSFGGTLRGRKWRKWWRHETTFFMLTISKTKRWFIVTELSMMSFEIGYVVGSAANLRLGNDGTNCSIVIKVAWLASVHVVHGFHAHWIGLVQHLSDAVWTRCWLHVPLTVRRSQLITLISFVRLLLTTANACTIVFIGRLSVTEDYNGEQCESVYCERA